MPTIESPVTAPAEKETVSACFKPDIAACAVLEFALVPDFLDRAAARDLRLGRDRLMDFEILLTVEQHRKVEFQAGYAAQPR